MDTCIYIYMYPRYLSTIQHPQSQHSAPTIAAGNPLLSRVLSASLWAAGSVGSSLHPDFQFCVTILGPWGSTKKSQGALEPNWKTFRSGEHCGHIHPFQQTSKLNETILFTLIYVVVKCVYSKKKYIYIYHSLLPALHKISQLKVSADRTQNGESNRGFVDTSKGCQHQKLMSKLLWPFPSRVGGWACFELETTVCNSSFQVIENITFFFPLCTRSPSWKFQQIELRTAKATEVLWIPQKDANTKTSCPNCSGRSPLQSLNPLTKSTPKTKKEAWAQLHAKTWRDV